MYVHKAQPPVGPGIECEDEIEGCAKAAAHEDYCKYTNKFMKKNCRKTCDFCRCKCGFLTDSIVKPIFHLATLLARREAKTRIRQRDCLKLAGEKICREQVGNVPTFLSVRANKVAKWKIGFRPLDASLKLVPYR